MTSLEPGADYQVDITIGPDLNDHTWTWTIHRGDPVTTFPVVLDGLTIGWTMPAADVWPVQPDPELAQLSILATDAEQLDGIDIGTPILIRIRAGADEDTVTFPGRITDLTGTARTFTHPVTDEAADGWQLDIIAADPTADLAEHTFAYVIADTPGWGVMKSRFQNAFVASGLPAPDWGDGCSGSGAANAALVNDGYDVVAQGTNLLAYAAGLLHGYPDAGELPPGADPTIAANYVLYPAQGWRRGIIAPNVDEDGTLDPLAPYRVEWVSRRPQPAVDHISADYLGYAATWTRGKLVQPNVIVAPNSKPDPTTPALAWLAASASSQRPGEAPVTAVVENKLAFVAGAQFLADMYLDDPDDLPGTPWVASGFRWHASRDPAWPLVRSFFPHTPAWGGYAEPVVITDLPTTAQPTPATSYAGVLRGASITFTRGQFVIDLDLIPRPTQEPE